MNQNNIPAFPTDWKKQCESLLTASLQFIEDLRNDECVCWTAPHARCTHCDTFLNYEKVLSQFKAYNFSDALLTARNGGGE